MFVRKVCVKNNIGLHSKPATNFVKKANEFKALIYVTKNEDSVNAKSLLGVLSLGIMGGITIKISAEGVDEEQAVETLVEFLESLS